MLWPGPYVSRLNAWLRWTNSPPATPAIAPETVNAVSFARAADTANACAPRSLSRTAMITRADRLLRIPSTAAKTTSATTTTYQK